MAHEQDETARTSTSSGHDGRGHRPFGVLYRLIFQPFKGKISRVNLSNNKIKKLSKNVFFNNSDVDLRNNLITDIGTIPKKSEYNG